MQRPSPLMYSRNLCGGELRRNCLGWALDDDAQRKKLLDIACKDDPELRSRIEALLSEATALVHEAYLRLAGANAAWDGKGHFFSAAAEAMRRILIERARRKGRIRHGGEHQRVELKEALVAAESQDEALAVDRVLDRFAEKHPEKAELVKLRYFVGMTNREAAEVMGISARTADRHWSFARAWILRELSTEE